MSELRVQRIIIACDAVCAMGSAIERAAALAAHWRAPLHGVFVEDAALLELAALPFSRQIVLSPTLVEALDPEGIARAFGALAGSARQSVAAAAARHGLDWSFTVTRASGSASGLAEEDADLFVLQGAVRPFGGRFQPRSRWIGVACELSRSVLLLLPARHPGRTTVALVEGAAGARRTLAAAAEMAQLARQPLVVLAGPDAPPAEALRNMLHGASPTHAAASAIEPRPPSQDALERRLYELHSGLLVVDADPADIDSAALRAIMAAAQDDVMLVR